MVDVLSQTVPIPRATRAKLEAFYNPSQAEGGSLETEPCRNVQPEREKESRMACTESNSTRPAGNQSQAGSLGDPSQAERGSGWWNVLSQTVPTPRAARAKLGAPNIPSQAEVVSLEMEPCRIVQLGSSQAKPRC